MDWLTSHLRVWRAPDMEPFHDSESETYPDESPDDRKERAYRLAMRETWNRFSSRHRQADLEPFSLPWFDYLAQKRYIRHAAWIPRLLEFNKHPGERVLLIGSGLGSDALEYARHGAKLTICSSDKEELHWTRRNLKLHNCAANLHYCDANQLPLADDSVDIVTFCGIDGPTQPLATVLEGAWRVLRPGGKIIAVLPARYGASYWRSRLCFWERWLFPDNYPIKTHGTFRKRTLKEELSQFEIRRITRRHLRRSDLPSFIRWAYFPVLERLFGRAFVIKAIKPINSIQMQSQAA